jgi:hypothetical protein
MVLEVCSAKRHGGREKQYPRFVNGMRMLLSSPNWFWGSKFRNYSTATVENEEIKAKLFRAKQLF